MKREIIKRDFSIWNHLLLCAGTLDNNIERVYNLESGSESAYVCLVGVPLMVSAQKNPDIARAINNSSMAVIDGMPIVMRARRLGLECDRFSGPDFMYPLLERGLGEKKRHFFYGSTKEVLDRLENNLKEKYPDIEICGTYSPPFRPLSAEEDDEIVRIINSSAPDFLWVGLGGNKQEIWMYEHYKKVNGCVMLGVGAVFDYLAGTLKEMPDWMEHHSLGWLFRLCQEPKRLWRRYILGGIDYLYYNSKYSRSKEYMDRRIEQVYEIAK